jgi:hypothetical protein
MLVVERFQNILRAAKIRGSVVSAVRWLITLRYLLTKTGPDTCTASQTDFGEPFRVISFRPSTSTDTDVRDSQCQDTFFLHAADLRNETQCSFDSRFAPLHSPGRSSQHTNQSCPPDLIVSVAADQRRDALHASQLVGQSLESDLPGLLAYQDQA